MSSLKYFCLSILCFFLLLETGYAQKIDGLDYTLQKRRKAEKFDSKRFSDHMFVTGGVGANMKLDRGAKSYIGPIGSFYVGKWFTPVIGSRIGLEASYMAVNEKNKAAIVGVNWDYLMNLSAFANRYNPDRFFELVGILGLNYHSALRYNSTRHVWGINAGFQGKFNISPLVDIFIEPKLSVYTDNIDYRTTWRKYDLFGSLMVGVNYKMIPLDKRVTTRFYNSFWDNIFISGGVGARMLISKGLLSSDAKNWPGPSAQFAMGSWITPSSGVRFSIDGGMSSWKAPENGLKYRLKTVGLRADYLLNLNSVFGGYNRDRLFELIGVAGVEVAFAKRGSNQKSYAPGVGLGLQGNLHLTSNLDFYIEPRISLYTNKLAGGNTASKLDALTAVNIGLIYNRAEREIRKNKDTFKKDVFSDNLFVALSGGLGGIISQPGLGLTNRQAMSGKITLSLGKWFTPISGIRLNGTGMIVGSAIPANKPRRYNALIAGVDYMLNITSAFTGYKENRLFNLIAAVGPSAFFRSQKVYPALEVGVQAHFSLNPNWGLFLEPHILWAADRAALSGMSTYKAFLPTANVGVSYMFRGYDRAGNRSLFESESGFSYFISLSGGASAYINNDMFNRGHLGGIGRVSLGRWFSPISAWRLSLSGERIPSGNGEFSVRGSLDAAYMLNLSTLAAGYNSNRIFSLSAILGVKAGLAATSSRDLRFIPGVSGGLHGAFRLNSLLDIFLEPQASVYFNHLDGNSKQSFVGNALIGLSYKLKNRTESSVSKDAPESPLFVSGALGTGVFANTIASRNGALKDKFSFNANVAVGRWLNTVSGVRLSLGTNTMRTNVMHDSDKMTIISLRADYLLNLTSCFSGHDSDRIFNMIGIVGIGAAFPAGVDNGKATYTGAIGLQGKFNVNRNWGIYIEPKVSIFGDKVDGRINSAKFDAVANVLLGTTYSF